MCWMDVGSTLSWGSVHCFAYLVDTGTMYRKVTTQCKLSIINWTGKIIIFLPWFYYLTTWLCILSRPRRSVKAINRPNIKAGILWSHLWGSAFGSDECGWMFVVSEGDISHPHWWWPPLWTHYTLNTSVYTVHYSLSTTLQGEYCKLYTVYYTSPLSLHTAH